MWWCQQARLFTAKTSAKSLVALVAIGVEDNFVEGSEPTDTKPWVLIAIVLTEVLRNMF